MSWRMLAIGALLVAGSGAANAKECRGVNFPDQTQVDGSPLVLNGLGMRKATRLKVNVYVAALYVSKASGDPNAILASNTPSELTLHFVRDVGASDIANAWSEGFANNVKAQLPALKDRIATLNGWMADEKTGQQIVFTSKPGVGVLVKVNGTAKGTIPGDDFAKALFSIWLGSAPPNPEIKAGLLGGTCE